MDDKNATDDFIKNRAIDFIGLLIIFGTIAGFAMAIGCGKDNVARTLAEDFCEGNGLELDDWDWEDDTEQGDKIIEITCIQAPPKLIARLMVAEEQK